MRTLVRRRKGGRSPSPPLPPLLELAPSKSAAIRPEPRGLDLSPSRAERSMPVTRVDVI